jgi:hypothetical protein
MPDWWQHRPWRLIQTNLREIDMLDIRAGRLLADLQSFQANVLMINAAGIIASYPTKLPFHFQSPYLKADSLQDILAACQAAGIRVIARTDFSKVRRPIHEQHPDWAYVSAQGRINEYNGDVQVCVNGDYQQRHCLEIIAELLDSHPFDGIFFNMAGYQTRDYSGNEYGPCHCANCRRLFHEMFAADLPVREDMTDPLWRKYCLFKQRTLQAHRRKLYNFIAARWPQICIANHRQFRRGFIRQESNTALDRPLPHWQYSASANTKWAVSSYPEMISSNATVDFIDFPCRHVAVSPHQQKLRLAQNLANGGALDYYLIGRLDNHEDRSGFAAVKEMFHYHAAHEDAYRRLRSLAEIALLHVHNTEHAGWFRFLVENHFLFDAPTPEAAEELSLERYRALIVPDAQPLSDTLAERLDRFVAAGGTLIAAGRAGFCDEHFEPRPVPALNCLGIRRLTEVRANTRSTYFKLDDKRGFGRFADTDLIYMDGPYIAAEYAADAQKRFKMIPPHNFGPPERCYYTTITGEPCFVVHPFGQGKAIHIPWLPGRLFHRHGHTNTFDFAADLLAGVAGLTPLGGNLPPQVEVTLFEKQDGTHRLLHLVNATGHFGVSFYPPATLTDLTVTTPCPSRPASVTGLVSGRPCDFHWQHGQLTVIIARLELFEAIQIQ